MTLSFQEEKRIDMIKEAWETLQKVSKPLFDPLNNRSVIRSRCQGNLLLITAAAAGKSSRR